MSNNQKWTKGRRHVALNQMHTRGLLCGQTEDRKRQEDPREACINSTVWESNSYSVRNSRQFVNQDKRKNLFAYPSWTGKRVKIWFWWAYWFSITAITIATNIVAENITDLPSYGSGIHWVKVFLTPGVCKAVFLPGAPGENPLPRIFQFVEVPTFLGSWPLPLTAVGESFHVVPPWPLLLLLKDSRLHQVTSMLWMECLCSLQIHILKLELPMGQLLAVGPLGND